MNSGVTNCVKRLGSEAEELIDRIGEAAEMVARLLLNKRPELIHRADSGYLEKPTSGIGEVLTRLLCYFSR